MFNSFISGGQVFLHKVRMFGQVLWRTIYWSLIIGIFISLAIKSSSLQAVPWDGFVSYRKAIAATAWDKAMNQLREQIGKAPDHITLIDAAIGTREWRRTDPQVIARMHIFKISDTQARQVLFSTLMWSSSMTFLCFLVIFLIWNKFGKDLSAEQDKEGSNKILSAVEVKQRLKMLNKFSDFYIGKLPLVKDMETMNFLVSGSIGTGKTNLFHNLLPQVANKKQAAVVIDNTGEMIAKYYNKKRGDIIFNPFDNRGFAWDFWADCLLEQDLEKFAEVLIGFNSRKNHAFANDFWETSASNIFVAIAQVLRKQKNYSIKALYQTLCQSDDKYMYELLQGTDAAKYFSKSNSKTVASITSVLIANIKPIKFLKDDEHLQKFSIEEYINNANNGNDSWLFLSTDPSARELTISLNAALLELLVSRLRRTRTNGNNKLWIVMDELPSLGKLPSLIQLMQEGRKYGTCVLAGLQSISQLYHYYGEANASSLIGLFKTKFAFASDDPKMGELYSKLCGSKTTISQQKNTSFGANEFRDGVSYNEKTDIMPRVRYEDFAQLNTGECYVLLPLPSVRLAKIQVPKATLIDKNAWFISQTQNIKAIEDDNARQLTDKIAEDTIAQGKQLSSTEIKYKLESSDHDAKASQNEEFKFGHKM